MLKKIHPPTTLADGQTLFGHFFHLKNQFLKLLSFNTEGPLLFKYNTSNGLALDHPFSLQRLLIDYGEAIIGLYSSIIF